MERIVVNSGHFDIKVGVVPNFSFRDKREFFKIASVVRSKRFLKKKIENQWVIFSFLSTEKTEINDEKLVSRAIAINTFYTFIEEENVKNFVVSDVYRDSWSFTDKPKLDPLSEDSIIYPIIDPVDELDLLVSQELEKFIKERHKEVINSVP